MKNTGKIISLVGPTASGKTDIAIQLAGLLGGEIISADSRLVYRDFNIGTAKPTAEEISIVPHHLIDIVDPAQNYTAGKYRKAAKAVIEDILSRNKIPIIAGGTGFYIKALLEGLDIPEAEPDVEFREEMRRLVEEKGKEFLYERLKQTDPETKLHPNDTFRIIRALEIQKNLEKPASEVQTISEPEYEVLYAGLNADDRDFLYERINRRVHIMIEKGLVKEVEYLVNKYGKTLSLLRTLGYKEICGYLDGACSLDEAISEIQKNTRNFAKRQLTWFRANKKIHWFYIDRMSNDEICEAIVRNNNERI